MDEHDPDWYPPPQITWLEFFWSIVRAVGLALAVALLILGLGGCDDYERQLRVQEWKDRFINGCMPRKGDTVTAQWVKGNLICSRTTPTGRYGRSFPHAEVRVATVEDIEL